MTQIPQILNGDAYGFAQSLQESVLLVPEMLAPPKERWKYAQNL